MSTLETVEAKMRRAEKHLKVATRIIRWFARNKCTVDRQPNSETHEIDAIARLPSPPEPLGTILGDAIHNMRSALDHAVYHLVLANPNRPSGVPNDQTMFPISDTREGFRRQVDKLNRIKGVSVESGAYIDRLQPYHAREAGLDYTTHVLWILNKLENIDKHRRLTIITGMATGHDATIRHPDGTITEHIVRPGGHLVRDGAILWSFSPPRPGQGEMEVKGTLYSTIGFDEPEIGVVVNAASLLWTIYDSLNDQIFPGFAGHIPPPH